MTTLPAAPLAPDVAQRIGRALPVGLVQRDQVGELEHVDLLELRRRAVVGRHHVDGDVDEVDDLRVALADARGLDDHEVEVRGLEHAQGLGAGLLAVRRALEPADRPRHLERRIGREPGGVGPRVRRGADAGREQLADHPLEAERAAVLGRTRAVAAGAPLRGGGR